MFQSETIAGVRTSNLYLALFDLASGTCLIVIGCLI